MELSRPRSIIGVALALTGCCMAACSPPPSVSSEKVILSSLPLERGYVPRACGLDMNRNGIIGEPADCNVCDGETTDPDGDGVDEDLIYVDTDEGSNRSGNGSPDRPYQTIQFAWSSADGPRDGAEDIICFRGWTTTEESITPGVSGVPGTYTVPRSGSQARDWKFPRDPTMLVGWDWDNDGAYPPYDRDDTAVLDGTGDGGRAGLARVFRLNPKTDYVEIAHLYIQDYGRYSFGADSGFIAFGPRGDGVDYTYYHDLELYSIHQDRTADGGKDFTIDIFNSGLHWANFSNLFFQDNGGWFVRGSGPDKGPDEGPFRWQNITRTMHGCDFSDCGEKAGWPGFKIWGYISRLEILDSIWDANVAHWEPNPHGGHGATAVVIGQCTQDWTIRNNAFLDPAIALRIQPASDGFCDDEKARPVDKVIFDRNIVRNTYGAWGLGNVGIDISQLERGEGDFPGETLGELVITNNFLSTIKTPWESCVHTAVGNRVATPPGRIVIANNTCFGQIRRSAAILIGGFEERETLAFQQQSFVIKNNIVAGLDDGQANLQVSYEPDDFVADSNIFDDDGIFRWVDDEELEFPAWQDISGGDESSRECEPEFEDEESGEFHLKRSDGCARGHGENLAGLNPTDFDGELRPTAGEAWDAGADQVTVAASEDPPYRFGGTPDGVIPGGTTEATLSLATNENGVCRWSLDPGIPYSAMTETFDVTNGKTHSTGLSDLVAGDSYRFYIRCLDALGHANVDDYSIVFTPADLNTGLLAHWALDEKDGVTANDTGGLGLHAKLVGSPTWSSGRSGKALALDGKRDHLELAPSPHLNRLSAFTLTAAVKVRSTGRQQAIFDKRDGLVDGLGVYLDGIGRLLVFLNSTTLTGGVRLGDGIWHHLAVVYDGEDLSLWVDGDTDSWDWMNAGPIETTAGLKIGGPWRQGAVDYLAGTIDQLRIYDRPLSELEIRRLRDFD